MHKANAHDNHNGQSYVISPFERVLNKHYAHIPAVISSFMLQQKYNSVEALWLQMLF